MSRNKREGFFAGKYGSAHIFTGYGKGKRVSRHRNYRNRNIQFSLKTKDAP